MTFPRPPSFHLAVFLAAARLLSPSLSAADTAADTTQSEWVYPGPDGKLNYKTTPRGDRIMDFSYAGYMGGGVPLPNVPVKRTVQPTGAEDESANIQNAINEVAALPEENGFRGAVLLAPGKYPCSKAIVLSASGIVLRGSGSAPGALQSTILMNGSRHSAIVTRRSGNKADSKDDEEVESSIADPYVPAGTTIFNVADAKGFAVGDTIELRRPVTEAWVKYMQMDNLVRDGHPQTWIRTGNTIPMERRIQSIDANKITVDVPLSDSFDAEYLNPPGTKVAKIPPPARLHQVGIEHLHIESPLQPVNHTRALYGAIRLNGEDCWAKDVLIEETMNSFSVGGRRITLDHVTINRKARHEGASKPAEFAPNGSQVLLYQCAVNADNVWFAGTGAGHSGPIVLLDCTFQGDGRVEGHQRWTTGMLVDNCRVPGGGIDFKNRGAMGSGHGWGLGWAVAWNCVANSYVIQQPPGTMNWEIGCVGANTPLARPFDNEPLLPIGTFDSAGKPVQPKSLYLTQLAERLGPDAVKAVVGEQTAVAQTQPIDRTASSTTEP